tara:strand:- start:4509 stop:4862 length:354 start_codon:yes stop_codon:yes gene_type:complete
MKYIGDIAEDGTVQTIADGAITDGKPVLVNADGTVSQVSGSVTLTAENFIGVTDAAYATGQKATIKTTGSIARNISATLTIGQQYFVQTDGSLGTTADDPSVIAGTAIGASELIVKG